MGKKKKRKGEKRVHKNKYAQHSKADQVRREMERQGGAGPTPDIFGTVVTGPRQAGSVGYSSHPVGSGSRPERGYRTIFDRLN